jgi:hypothetical protein
VQLLSRFEADGFAGCDADLGAGTGIAANACFARADAENAKSAQFDALTGGQSLLQALEDRIHRGFCLDAGQARALDYMMDDVLLNQWGNLTGKYDFTTIEGKDATDFHVILGEAKPSGTAFRRKPGQRGFPGHAKGADCNFHRGGGKLLLTGCGLIAISVVLCT